MAGFGFGSAIARMQSGGRPPGLGLVVGRLPDLPMRPDRVVYTRSELVAAIAASPNTAPQDWAIAVAVPVLDLGQTNVTGFGFEDRTLVVDRACTIYPMAGYGPFDSDPYGDKRSYARRFARTCTIKGFVKLTADVRWYGFRHQIDVFPAKATQTSWQSWEEIGITKGSPMLALANVGNPEVQGCEFVVGHDFAGTPFDPTRHYDDMKSPAVWEYRVGGGSSIVPEGDPDGARSTRTGWGDTDWVTFNRYNDMPGGINFLSWVGRNAVVAHNYAHDLCTGIKCLIRGEGTQNVEIRDNDIARCYRDLTTITYGNQTDARVKYYRNILRDPIGHAFDGANPHCDGLQSYGTDNTNSLWRTVAHFKAWANLMLVRTANRSQMQGFFMSMSAGGYAGSTEDQKNRYKLVGAAFHSNISLNVNKGISIGGQQSTLISNCVMLTPDDQSARINPQILGPATFGFRRADSNHIGPEEIPDTLSIAENSIFEGVGDLAWRGSYRLDDCDALPIALTPGRSQQVGKLLEMLDGEQSNPDQIFKRLTVPAGDSRRRVKALTLEEMLSMDEPDMVRFGFVPATKLPIGTLAESSLSYVHGVLGRLRPVRPDPGVEWRSLDAVTGAVLTSWSAADGTIASGSMIQIRARSASGEVQTVTHGIEIDGVREQWAMTTAALSQWPLLNMAGAHLQSAGSLGVADSGKLTLALDFVYSANGTMQIIAEENYGANVTMSINASGQLYLLLRDGSGKNMTIKSATYFTAGKRYSVLLSIDTAQPDLVSAVRLYVNGSKDALETSTFAQGAMIRWGVAQAWHLFANRSNGQSFVSPFGFLALWTDAAVDWSIAANRDAMAYAAWTSSDMSALTGTDPVVLIHGDAASINALNGANRGRGAPLDNVGTDAVDLPA